MKQALIPRPDMNVRIATVLWIAVFIFIVIVGLGLMCAGIGIHEGPLGFIGKTGDLLIRRGVIPFFTVAAFALTISILHRKFRLIHMQLNFIQQEPAPEGINFHDHDAVGAYIDNLKAKPHFEDNMLTTRLSRLLEAWLASGTPDRIADMAVEEAEFDYSVRDDGHRLLITLLWSIPILGFVGTVMGISGAVGGFTRVMEAADSLVKLKEGIQAVTMSLSVAFDTTFVALILALIGTFTHTIAKSKEDAVIESIDTFVEDHLISKLHTEEQEKVVRWLTKEEEREAIQEAVIQHIPRPEDYTTAFGGVIREAAGEIAGLADQSAQSFRQQADGLRGVLTEAAEQQRNVTTTFARGLAEQLRTGLQGLSGMEEKVTAATTGLQNVIVETGRQQQQEMSTFAQGIRDQLMQALRETNTVQQQIVSASQGLPALIQQAAEQQRQQSSAFVERLTDQLRTSFEQTTATYERAMAAATEKMQGALVQAGVKQQGENEAMLQRLQSSLEESVRSQTGVQERLSTTVEGVVNAIREAGQQQIAAVNGLVQSLREESGKSVQQFSELREAQRGAGDGIVNAIREAQTAMDQSMRSHVESVEKLQTAQTQRFQEGEQRVKTFFENMERTAQAIERQESERLGKASDGARQAGEWLQNAQTVFQQAADTLMKQMQQAQQFIAVLNNLSESEKGIAERLQRLQGDKAFRDSIDRFVAAQEQMAAAPRGARRLFGFRRK